jgi:hypothetical protein
MTQDPLTTNHIVDPLTRQISSRLTIHDMRKLRNPNFNAEKAAYANAYYYKNKEKLKAYNIARFARLKAERLAAEIELEDLTNLVKDFQNV